LLIVFVKGGIMGRVILVAGALMCAASVACGAFGAHAITDMVTVARLDTWQTASKYLMHHGLGLLIIGQLTMTVGTSFTAAAVQIFIGATLFSLSLYLLVLLDMPWLGAIAPVGGLLMITGWITSAVTLFKQS
jgi:uncharacterized membrane protein YgdD (TMEM256/DUF423 family)